jgi:hypothetical protein
MFDKWLSKKLKNNWWSQIKSRYLIDNIGGGRDKYKYKANFEPVTLRILDGITSKSSVK